MNDGLYIHCGANTATLDEVKEVKTPGAEYRGEQKKFLFQPVPHHILFETVKRELTSSGALKVTGEAHALTKGGQRYFGLLEVKNGDNSPDYGVVIGMRNGHDGAFAAGLTLGARVFVCDNLSFSGDVVFGRSHTRNILADLPGLVHRAYSGLMGFRKVQDSRFEAYRQIDLEDRDAHSLILRSMRSSVIGQTGIDPVLREWESPSHDEFRPKNVWRLYNAFTEAMKPRRGDSPSTLPNLSSRTQKLHGLLDSYCGVMGAQIASAN